MRGFATAVRRPGCHATAQSSLTMAYQPRTDFLELARTTDFLSIERAWKNTRPYGYACQKSKTVEGEAAIPNPSRRRIFLWANGLFYDCILVERAVSGRPIVQFVHPSIGAGGAATSTDCYESGRPPDSHGFHRCIPHSCRSVPPLDDETMTALFSVSTSHDIPPMLVVHLPKQPFPQMLAPIMTCYQHRSHQ